MKMAKLYISVFSSVLMVFISSCAQNSSVTKAPHRTTAVNKIAGTIQSSYPITTSKNSGFGSALGSLGGSIGGANIGSGTGRIVGAFTGGLLGSIGGSKTETTVRQQSAQELILKINEKTYKFINNSNNSYHAGDKIWVNTNVYGDPLSITHR